MASEAFQEARRGIESAKDDAFLVVLAQGNCVAVERSIPRQSVFAIRFAIDFGDKRNGLKTRTESPIAALRRGRGCQCARVRGIGLRCEVGRVAGTASFGSRIIGGSGGEHDGNQAEGGHGGEAHFSPAYHKRQKVRRYAGPFAALHLCCPLLEPDARHELAVARRAETARAADIVVAKPGNSACRVVYVPRQEAPPSATSQNAAARPRLPCSTRVPQTAGRSGSR